MASARYFSTYESCHFGRVKSFEKPEPPSGHVVSSPIVPFSLKSVPPTYVEIKFRAPHAIDATSSP